MNNEKMRSPWAAAFSIVLLLAVIVVAIVNVAVSGTFTWSLIPMTACIFAWLVFFPTIRFGFKGIVGSLIVLCILVIPFLFVLDLVIDRFVGYNTLVFAMGVRLAPLMIVLVWVAYFLFKKFSTRKLIVVASLVFIAGPISFFTNVIINRVLNQTGVDTQSVLNGITPIGVAIILFIIDLVIRKGGKQQ